MSELDRKPNQSSQKFIYRNQNLKGLGRASIK